MIKVSTAVYCMCFVSEFDLEFLKNMKTWGETPCFSEADCASQFSHYQACSGKWVVGLNHVDTHELWKINANQKVCCKILLFMS